MSEPNNDGQAPATAPAEVKTRKKRVDAGQPRAAKRAGGAKMFYILTDPAKPGPAQRMPLKKTKLRDCVKEILANAARVDDLPEKWPVHSGKQCEIISSLDTFLITTETKVTAQVKR